jgi:branched-chain amino acid transport system substrate-binding protein
MSWENNTNSAAIGQAMTIAGVKKAFFISQNYVTGKEYVAGAKKHYTAETVGEAYVPIEQTDYAAEIAAIRAARPDAVYVFLPGAGGIAFVKQFAGSGLKSRMRLFSGSWIADEHSFAALGDAAEGIRVTANWFADLDNPENAAFVSAFRAKYGRRPVVYAAMVYDNIMLLDRAVTSLKGDIGDRAALREAILKADFKSVRGPFGFNTNQFPIQNFYAADVIKDDGVLRHKVAATIATGFKDDLSGQCHMPA